MSIDVAHQHSITHFALTLKLNLNENGENKKDVCLDKNPFCFYFKLALTNVTGEAKRNSKNNMPTKNI